MHSVPVKAYLSVFFLFHFLVSVAQGKFEFYGFAGMSNYQGDLQSSAFTLRNARPSFGANLRYGISEKIFLRAGLGTGHIRGDDKKNQTELQVRNLNFRSSINDVHLGMEYRFLRSDWIGITPYFFAGVGLFHFNPYTYYGNMNEKVFLQPLGTEGQGLPEYPDREMYNLTQIFLPFAGGILWELNNKIKLGFEFRQNMVFTDYLDDVSNTYPQEAPLLRDRGSLAVELSWRRDEFDGRPYPTDEIFRGDPGFKDWFYYLGFLVGISISNDSGAGKSGRVGKGSIRQLGCPKWNKFQ